MFLAFDVANPPFTSISIGFGFAVFFAANLGLCSDNSNGPDFLLTAVLLLEDFGCGFLGMLETSKRGAIQAYKHQDSHLASKQQMRVRHDPCPAFLVSMRFSGL
jgi:hypothetical protein